MKAFYQTGIISLICIALYFGLRALPVESCELLHYGDYINSEGIIEGCGYEETNFFVMEEIKFPIIIEIQPLGELVAGKKAQCLLNLKTTTGKQILWEDISISHTERIHAMIVDESLQDYQHIHPQHTSVPGKFEFSFTPKYGGTYRLYLDFIPLTTSRRTLLSSALEVEGSSRNQNLSKSKSFNLKDLSFNLDFKGEKPTTNKMLSFEIKLDSDQPVEFSTVMGSFAHMVAFDEKHTGFAHLHPANPSILGQDPSNPDLSFTIEFDQAGLYQIWAQMKINGEELFIPFTIDVSKS